MKIQQCQVLVLTKDERNMQHKDDVIKRQVQQSDLVLTQSPDGDLVVLKDKFGMML